MPHSARTLILAVSAALALIPLSETRAGDEELLQKLLDPAAQPFDGLGGISIPEGSGFNFPRDGLNAMAAEGELLVVGAPMHDGDVDANAGQVLVFRDGPDGWELEARLEHPAPALDGDWDAFGLAVDVSDGRIAIGAPKEINPVDDTAAGPGEVFVYEQIDGAWTLAFQAQAEEDDDGFGRLFSLDGDRLVVVARSFTSADQLRFYERGVEGWAFTDAFAIAQSPTSIPPSASSIDLEGELLAVGDTLWGSVSGAILVYREGELGWELEDTLQNDTFFSRRLGRDVSLSGARVAATANFDPSPPSAPNGSLASVWRLDSESWSEETTALVDFGGSATTNMSVDLDGDRLVVGNNARPFFGQATGPGFATLFRFDATNGWLPTYEITPDDAQGGDFFGNNVVLDGERLFVGAPNHTPGEVENQGAVYVYDITPGAWSNQAAALFGNDAEPLLMGEGDLSPDTRAAVQLLHARPEAPAALFVALESVPVPFAGGTLKATPTLGTPIFGSIEADGTQRFEFIVRAGAIPTGEVWFQWAIADADAAQGVALSNALRGTAP